MHTTPPSLLERLRQPNEQAAWERFVEIYTPLIYFWACKIGLQNQDAVDLVQDVFTTLIQKMPTFTYKENQSFRAWLRTVALNKWRDKRRKSSLPLEPGNGDVLNLVASNNDAEAVWEAEYHKQIVGRALEIMQAEFSPTVWKACWETTVLGHPPSQVAAKLGISVASVYAAKSRVLRRLRQELVGLLD
jgi:RNA polymerase sigma-70 factor (ECF subfamily)